MGLQIRIINLILSAKFASNFENNNSNCVSLSRRNWRTLFANLVFPLYCQTSSSNTGKFSKFILAGGFALQDNIKPLFFSLHVELDFLRIWQAWRQQYQVSAADHKVYPGLESMDLHRFSTSFVMDFPSMEIRFSSMGIHGSSTRVKSQFRHNELLYKRGSSMTHGICIQVTLCRSQRNS